MSFRATSWQEKSECRHYFDFTEWEIGNQLLLCGVCPVTAECIQLGLSEMRTPKDAEHSAVYGGLRPIQLAELVRKRNAARRKAAAA